MYCSISATRWGSWSRLGAAASNGATDSSEMSNWADARSACKVRKRIVPGVGRRSLCADTLFGTRLIIAVRQVTVKVIVGE